MSHLLWFLRLASRSAQEGRVGHIFLCGMPFLSSLCPAGEIQQIPAPSTASQSCQQISVCMLRVVSGVYPRLPFPSLGGNTTQEGDTMPPSVGLSASCSMRGSPTHFPERSAPGPELHCPRTWGRMPTTRKPQAQPNSKTPISSLASKPSWFPIRLLTSKVPGGWGGSQLPSSVKWDQ